MMYDDAVLPHIRQPPPQPPQSQKPLHLYSRIRVSAIELLRYLSVIVPVNYIRLPSNTKMPTGAALTIFYDTIDNK